jgi:hypothetical protein
MNIPLLDVGLVGDDLVGQSFVVVLFFLRRLIVHVLDDIFTGEEVEERIGIFQWS